MARKLHIGTKINLNLVCRITKATFALFGLRLLTNYSSFQTFNQNFFNILPETGRLIIIKL